MAVAIKVLNTTAASSAHKELLDVSISGNDALLAAQGTNNSLRIRLCVREVL